MAKSYSLLADSSPVTFSSALESTKDSGQSCSTVSASYTTSNIYNNGTVNTDPIYTHNLSFVKGYVSYQLLNNAPIIVESSI